MSFDEANYKNLSQVLRSNIFPYVEQPWSSSARTTHASLKAAAYTGKVNGLSKDWLGKWHENEVHRRNIMQGYENRHSERMSAAGKYGYIPKSFLVRHWITRFFMFYAFMRLTNNK